MIKAKDILRLIFFLIFILALIIYYHFPVEAATLRWSAVNLPTDGPGGNWMLAKGSDVRFPTVASDGTLYCCANPTATPFRLFKSSDGGYSWSYTGRVTDTIVDIAVLPDNPDGLFYASSSGVYRSNDAGDNFTALPLNPAGAGSGHKSISSLDAVSANGSSWVVISIKDTDAGEFGGVYLWSESQPDIWSDTGLRNLDVSAVFFSPNYAADRQIVAVASDEHDIIVTTLMSGGVWGAIIGDARIPGITLNSVSLSFPTDYSSNISQGKYTQYIAINSGRGDGDVYCLKGKAAPLASTLTDLNAGQVGGLNNIDITSLAVTGNADSAMIIAGATSSVQTYFSNNSGQTWQSSHKPPTGSSNSYVCLSLDFASSSRIYAATSGTESAFSISLDRGDTWNQIGLIDTRISDINDLAVSPDYAQDNTLFLLTTDVKNSLWFSSSGGNRWERRFCSVLPDIDYFDLVQLSPMYGQNHKVFLAGASSGGPVIWKSADRGQSFSKTRSVDSGTGAPLEINAWTVTLRDKLFVGSFNGSQGIVYQTDNDGLSYTDKAFTDSLALNSVAISPGFDSDGTLLAGDNCGNVYYSHDGGRVFEKLPQAPFSGMVTIAFDPDFSRNQTVYAAGNSLNKSIYRFVIGESTAWENIDSTLPVGAQIGQVVTSPAGLLYGVNLQIVNNSQVKGGVERILNPRSEPSPGCETVILGLDDNSVLKKLWVRGNTLWTVDATHKKLLTYTDTQISPIILNAPAASAANLNPHNLILSWSAADGAAGYNWQLDTDNQFADIPHGLEGDSDVTSVQLTNLNSDTTYYWRVSANQPVTGPWSAVRSFNTNSLPSLDIPRLTEPRFNSISPVQPTFKWTSSTGAVQYEFQLAVDNSFAHLVIDKTGGSAFRTDAWICEVVLPNNSSYYWKVRAVSGENKSAWSDVGVFTTQAVPTPSQSSSSGGSSSGGSSASSTPKTSTTPTPTPATKTTPTITPSITPSPSPSPSPAEVPLAGQSVQPAPPTPFSEKSQISGGSQLDLGSSGLSSNIPTPAPSVPVSVSPSPAATPAPPSSTTESASGDSFIRLLFFLVGGLVVLTLVMIIIIIFMLKRFKQY